jgi:acyl carrier protein
MIEKSDVLAAIYRAIDDINKQLPAEKRLEKDEAAVISTLALDSLNLVNFMVCVEEQLQLECGLEVDLGSSLSPGEGAPFTNVSELAEYVLQNASNSDLI